jgi:hypothetical protein
MSNKWIAVVLMGMLELTGAARAADLVSGAWTIEFESQSGAPIVVTMHLEQSGDAVTGKITGPEADVPMTGSVKGNTLELNYSIDFGQGPVAIKLTGTVDATTFVGTGDYGALGKGEFHARRQ